jgi:hypothetical protein
MRQITRTETIKNNKMKKTHPRMHPNFKTLPKEDKIFAKKWAKQMMTSDTFFIDMLTQGISHRDTFISALAMATRKTLQGNFHTKFGDRPTSIC